MPKKMELPRVDVQRVGHSADVQRVSHSAGQKGGKRTGAPWSEVRVPGRLQV